MEKEKKKGIGTGTGMVIGISIVYILLGLALLLVPAFKPSYIVYAAGTVLLIYGIILIVKYFLSGGFRELGRYDFSGGVLCVIIAACMLIRAGVVSRYIPLFLGLCILLTSIIKLQNSVALKSLENKLWLVFLIIAIAFLALSMVIILDLLHKNAEEASYIYAVLTIDGAVNLFETLYFALAIRSHQKRLAQESAQGREQTKQPAQSAEAEKADPQARISVSDTEKTGPQGQNTETNAGKTDLQGQGSGTNAGKTDLQDQKFGTDTGKAGSQGQISGPDAGNVNSQERKFGANPGNPCSQGQNTGAGKGKTDSLDQNPGSDIGNADPQAQKFGTDTGKAGSQDQISGPGAGYAIPREQSSDGNVKAGDSDHDTCSCAEEQPSEADEKKEPLRKRLFRKKEKP